MHKENGYGFQPAAGEDMDINYPGIPYNAHSNAYLLEILSEFPVLNPENFPVLLPTLTKSRHCRYVIPIGLLYKFLETGRDHYEVMHFGSELTALNSMVYYDVPGYRLFRDHMNGKAGRCQVKLKKSPEIQAPIIEVKFRSNKGVSGKHLMPFQEDLFHLLPEELKDKFIQLTGTSVSELRPVVESSSEKFVLLGRMHHERIEVDAEIRFSLPGSGEKELVLPLAVVRISNNQGQDTLATRFFGDHRIRPFSFSRYLLGGSMLLTDQKTNRYKNKILQFQKMMQHEPSY